MTVENVTNIDDLNVALPGPADPKSEGDDHIRNLKKALQDDFAGFTGAICVTGTDGGAANAYTLTPDHALPAYGLRMGIVFSPAAANTGASTLNISGLGVKPLRAVDGSELVSGDLAMGVIYAAYYTGSEFRLCAPTKQYIDAVRAYAAQLAFSTVLPNQAGNAGKALFTDGANAFWKVAGVMSRSARTANTQLVAADLGSLIDITSGTFTQTFDTAANLGSGWFCYIRNNGTGNITIPASDGRTNWIMYPNEVRLFQCDGVNFFSIVLQAYKLTAQISGTWIKPPGYNYHHERLTGSGAGGGGGGAGAAGASSNSAGGWSGGGGSGGAGGSSGVTLDAIIADSALPNSVPFTIGATGVGGNGGAGAVGQASGTSTGANGSSGTAGTAGNASTFGTVGQLFYLSAAGGAVGGPPGAFGGFNGGAGGTPVTNSAAVGFSSSATGVISLPVVAPVASSAGAASADAASNSPGGSGGNGGPGGAPAAMIAAPALASGGAGSTVAGTAGTNGAAGVTSTAPGAGGQGGGGGGGSAGCGTSTNAATGKGGDGGRGADGTPGAFEMTGIV